MRKLPKAWKEWCSLPWREQILKASLWEVFFLRRIENDLKEIKKLLNESKS